MNTHLDLTDEQFEVQFESCSLPPAVFIHEAHIRLAWIHIKKYGINKAVENVCGQLKVYVAYLGAEDKYNETLTVAAVRAVYHFMLKSEAVEFVTFIKKNQRLLNNFKELMYQHYVTDIFSSPLAKKQYLEPELLPFD